MASASLPFVLQDALQYLSSFLSSIPVTFGRSGNRLRSMRSDRRKNILAVASVMLQGCCLQFDGIICHFERGWVRPKSIPEIATLARICPRTVDRCIADMVDLGLLESRQIKRKNSVTGQFEVSIGLRCFTQKFWEALGLWEKIQVSIKRAKEYAKRKFILPFKKIGLKIKTTAQHTGDLVKSTLKMLSDDALRVRTHCDAIREMLKQNKAKNT